MATPSGSGPSAPERDAPRIRPLRLTGRRSDLGWVEALLDREFAGRRQARLGVVVDALEGDGLVAEDAGGTPLGLVAWTVGGASSGHDEAEVRVLAVEEGARGRGVGTALLRTGEAALRRGGARRAWLLTTNDNTAALAFYQRRGWRLAELHPGAVDEARATLKPGIATVGSNGIAIHDELVLRRDLGIPDLDGTAEAAAPDAGEAASSAGR